MKQDYDHSIKKNKSSTMSQQQQQLNQTPTIIAQYKPHHNSFGKNSSSIKKPDGDEPRQRLASVINFSPEQESNRESITLRQAKNVRELNQLVSQKKPQLNPQSTASYFIEGRRPGHNATL